MEGTGEKHTSWPVAFGACAKPAEPLRLSLSQSRPGGGGMNRIAAMAATLPQLPSAGVHTVGARTGTRLEKKKIAWGAPCVDASRRRGHCGKLGALGTPGVREYGTGVKPTGQSRPSSGHLEHLLLYTDRVRVGTMPLPSDRIRRGCRHRTGSRPSHPSSSTTRATISLAGLR